MKSNIIIQYNIKYKYKDKYIKKIMRNEYIIHILSKIKKKEKKIVMHINCKKFDEYWSILWHMDIKLW